MSLLDTLQYREITRFAERRPKTFHTRYYFSTWLQTFCVWIQQVTKHSTLSEMLSINLSCYMF